jgi:hypothetical protein
MATYTAGELKSLNWVNESAYGTIPTAALSWGGDIVSLTPSIDMKVQYLTASGSRAFNTTTKGAYDVGFSVKARARANATPYFWYNFWMLYGCGTTATTADHLGSFTAQVAKLVGASPYYNYFNGCKFNKFSINYVSPGEPIILEGDIWAQYVTPDTDKAMTGIQAVTVGADAAEQTGAVLTWSAVSQVNIAAGGLATWYPKTMKLTVDNHLERQYGHIGTYPVAIALTEGPRDIILEVTLPHNNETYTNAKLAGSAVTAVTLPIDGGTLTLGDGVWEANDFPELKHDVMEESSRIRFKTIART